MRRIGVDLGGTKTEIILTEENVLEIIARKRVKTHQQEGYEPLVAQVAGLIEEYMLLAQDEVVIGLGVPGSISPQSGVVQGGNTRCLNGRPLKEDLEVLLGHSVHVENDANCFALSEALLGAGAGHKAVLGIIMGTGVGGGAVYSGKLWKGVHGNASELGHMILKSEGARCWCGRVGCMELYLSGVGIEGIYQEQAGRHKPLPEIYRSHMHGTDPIAGKVMADFVENFGRGMGNLLTIFDPSILVIGGGVSNLPILYEEGAAAAIKHSFHPECPVPIVQNKLGDSSGIYGAAMLGGKP